MFFRFLSSKHLRISVGICIVCALAAGGYLFAMYQHQSDSVDNVQMVDREEPELAPQRPEPVFVYAKDPTVPYEDAPYAGIDERSSFRVFKVRVDKETVVSVVAANLHDPLWREDANDENGLIARLNDGNAAFVGSVEIDIPAPAHWKQAKIHIGEFSQDYCGDVTALYSFRTASVFAIARIPDGDIDFRESQCPLSREDYTSNKESYGVPAVSYGDFSDFCIIRAQCLKAYYTAPERREQVLMKWVEKVSELDLATPSPHQ